ncbi:hypothetical protein KKA02_03960 [Patescibacteria group bacterium]|nr:hypothetical protein [Patescibacteria group bacterium]
MNKLNAQQLRSSKANKSKSLQKSISRNPIVLILDNILDTYNIGSFFRLADAIAAQKIYLCGKIITPPNIKIHRASIGTWKWIPWEQINSTKECIKQLKKTGYQIIACEQSPKSITYTKTNYKFPIAILIGNESTGIPNKLLNEVDKIVEIPMHGINKSLNVLIAASIICYDSLKKLKN